MCFATNAFDTVTLQLAILYQKERYLTLRVVKGGLNHESREINEVFHDSHKFFEGFTFHVKSVGME